MSRCCGTSWSLLAIGLLFAGPTVGAVHVEPRQVAVLAEYADAETGDQGPAIRPWNWTDEQKAQAGRYSNRTVLNADAKRVLQLTVSPELPWGRQNSHRALSIGPDLLPPEGDSILLRCRVTEGSMIVSFGGPTVYFGHSDVHSEPVTLTPAANGGWRNVYISLADNLQRNYRRARFAKDAPVVYYTRWIQEPLHLIVHKGSAGVLQIERIELVHLGRGRPYPTFKDKDVALVAVGQDFARPEDLAAVRTVCQEDVDFSGPPKLARPAWRRPKVSRVAGDDEHRGLLHIAHRGEEEVVHTTVQVRPAAEANAIAFDLKASSESRFNELCLDFLLYVAPEPAAFPWAKFAPPASWRGDDNAFDAYLSLSRTRALSHAFYHARRTMPNGRWTRVIVPLDDFVCVFGAGEMAESFTNQLPPDGANAVSIGVLPPWRQRKAETVIDIDSITWVRVPKRARLTSFPHAQIRCPAGNAPHPGGPSRPTGRPQPTPPAK